MHEQPSKIIHLGRQGEELGKNGINSMGEALERTYGIKDEQERRAFVTGYADQLTRTMLPKAPLSLTTKPETGINYAEAHREQRTAIESFITGTLDRFDRLRALDDQSKASD